MTDTGDAIAMEENAMGASLYSSPLGVLIFLGGGSLLLLVLLKATGGVLAPLLFTFTLAVTVVPLIQALERRGFKRGLAVASVFGGAFVVAGLALFFVVGQLQVFAQRIPEYQAMLAETLAPLRAQLQARGIASETLAPVDPSTLAHLALDLTGKMLAQAASLSVFLFLLLIMALEAPSISHAFVSHVSPLSPLLPRYRAFLHEVQAQYKIATLSNLASAIVLTVAYVAFRIDFALLWGFLTFFLSYIPRFGMLLSFIPPVLMAFIQHGPRTSLLVLLLGFVINVLMDNVITPRMTGKGLSLRTSVVAIGAMIWLWVFGPLGALLSVSLMLFIRMILASSPLTLPLAYVLSTEEYVPPEVPTPETPPPDAP